jgi:dihydroorotase
MTIIEGTIATHDKKPFYGRITVDDKTGLISKVEVLPKGKRGKSRLAARQVGYEFGKDELIFAGFGDVHIHAREDQTGKQTHKEEYETAGDAALQGGVVHACAMPNTPMPVTKKSDFAWHRKRIQELAHPATILNYVGIDATTKPLGKPDEHFYKLYFGKSVGSLTVTYAGELDSILSKYRGHHISFHVEYEPIVQAHAGGETHSDRRPVECVNEGLRLLLPLIEEYEIHAKLCHWSTGDENFHLIAEARKRGADIVLEVSPLHLLFDTSMTDKNPELWLKIQMNPAIQARRHREQLIRGLNGDFIQFLATDHAPHTEEEKYSAFEKFRIHYPKLSNVEMGEKIKKKDPGLFYAVCKENGMSGAPWLDVYGLVCTHLMNNHDFSAQDIARVAAYNPGKFVNPHLKRQFPKKDFGKGFGEIKKGFVGSFTVLNTQKKTKVVRENLKTKCGWSPLEGRTMRGAVEAVFVRGKRMV